MSSYYANENDVISFTFSTVTSFVSIRSVPILPTQLQYRQSHLTPRADMKITRGELTCLLSSATTPKNEP